MFLTRFPINTTRRNATRMLASPYALHAAIAGSIPRSSSETESGRVLWRVDREHDGRILLYIVSPVRPSLIGLDEQIGWPDIEHQWVTKNYDSFLSNITEGQCYQFRLTANTVVNRTSIKDGQGRSKRLPHVTALQRAAWLVGDKAYEEVAENNSSLLTKHDLSRAARNGFDVLTDEDQKQLMLRVSEFHEFDMLQGKKGNHIKLSTTQFDGLLRVNDAEKLRHALIFGIGHAKAFGCGLLTLSLVDQK